MTFDRPDYEAWRVTRFDFLLEHFGAEFFQNKTLLEVGCGYGHLGNRFYQLGAIVTCSDGRQSNVDVTLERFSQLSAVVSDLDNEFPEGYYDICIHTGVLYHLKNFDFAIEQACKHSNYLVLETETVDSNDPDATIRYKENPEIQDAGLQLEGNRVSAAHIERELTRWGKIWKRFDSPKLNSGIHLYDWKVTGSNQSGPNHRRFWIARDTYKYIIAHRGNIEGPSEYENRPAYIRGCLALNDWVHCEIDVWVIGGEFFLGHDAPLYKVDERFLIDARLWCHAKNLTALDYMIKNPLIHCFWHQEDSFTLTSRGYIWTYPGQPLISERSICVMPELGGQPSEICAGICTDFVENYS